VWRRKNNKIETRRLVWDANNSGNSHFYQRLLCPPYNAFNVLPLERTAWNISELSPGMSSMYNDIISLYRTNLYKSSKIPELCRRVVLWSCTAQIHHNSNLVAQEVAAITCGSPWEDRTVGRLVRARLQIQRLEERIQININALGIGAVNPIAHDWEAKD